MAACEHQEETLDDGWQDGAVRGGGSSGPGVMDRTAVVKVGAAASASVCALFGGVVLAQYIVAKKKRAGKKTRIIEMVSQNRHAGLAKKDSGNRKRVCYTSEIKVFRA